MIHFPAIFKLSGQDELLYIADQTAFYAHYQLHQPYLLPDDVLIDSAGQAYPLWHCAGQLSGLHAMKEFDLPELTALVQAHFSATAQLCAVKIQAANRVVLLSLLQEHY